MRAIGVVLLSVIPLGCFLGCGSKSGPPAPEKLPTVAVTGKVTYRENPVVNALVMFHPKEGAVTASGKTDAGGNFILTTYAPDDGAPVGGYVVTIEGGNVTPRESEPGVLAPIPGDGKLTPIKQKLTIPAIYNDQKTTTLNYEVTQAGPNQFNIVLK